MARIYHTLGWFLSTLFLISLVWAAPSGSSSRVVYGPDDRVLAHNIAAPRVAALADSIVGITDTQ
jgi:hypothetical protein